MAMIVLFVIGIGVLVSVFSFLMCWCDMPYDAHITQGDYLRIQEYRKQWQKNNKNKSWKW